MAVARQAMVDDRLVKAEAGINPKARRDELAFLPAVLEVSETPPSPLGRVIAWTIIAFAVITVLWAVIGRMDIIAVAQGRIIPTERVKLVQPRDAGVVRAIHVTEGQAVRTGDVLIELDPTETQASIDQLTTDLVATLLDLARLEALLEPDPQKAFSAPADAPAGLVALYRDYFTSQVRERRAREEVLVGEVRVRRSEVATLRAEVGHLDTMLPRLRDRIGKRRALLDKGVIPHLAFTEEEDSLVNMEGRRSVTAQRLVEVEAALAKAEQDLDHADSQFRREVHAELSQTRVRLAVLEQEIRKARDRSQRQTLVAPIDGTVQGLNIHTIGGVVIEAQ